VGSLEPTTEAGRQGLAALLAEPGRALIALDFDGTLAPIVPDPDAARAHPGVRPAFDRLSGLLGRIAVVTGRPAQVAVNYGGLADIPGLVVLGHYGLERWSEGDLQAPADDEGVAVVRRRLPELLRELGAADGTAIEDKGRSLAVHVRRAGDPVAAMAVVEPALRALASDTGLVVEPGRMVLELRPAGADKGAALRSLVDELAPSAVVFVGDDLGDLAAFTAVDELRADGLPGLLVCSGSTEVTELADRADLVVDGPAGVVEFLESLADALVSPAPPPGS
jgi:trehalose 6-phosphate phosphatase